VAINGTIRAARKDRRKDVKTLKKPAFWGGFVVGLVVGPWALSKVAPGLKARIPSG